MKVCIQGSLQLMWELEQDFNKITGMDAFSLQPAAGAQGELLGVMITKAYYKQKHEKRTKVIIPDSAHGTNPATAAMCKLETVTVPSDSRGNMDIYKFKELLEHDVALVMLTNPNTLGLFEEKILEISDLAHNNGTLMYCDGANMNALLGITRPGDQGFDLIHLNLHKTFSTPHGGGGPGAGAVGVKSFLADYLPLPRIVKNMERYILDYSTRKSVGMLKYCYGNFGMLVRAYSYIRSWGSDLRRISQHSTLNANYLLSLLRNDFELPFDCRCAHEFVLSSKNLGQKSALNIAKRLMDYGFHPPTIYFPLIVPEALMIEPTETESKETLDEFATALKAIANEIKDNPDMVKGSPYTRPVGRLDESCRSAKTEFKMDVAFTRREKGRRYQRKYQKFGWYHQSMIKAHNIYKSKKLIKISLEYTDNNKIISSIRITGDFFLYPEETLDQIEASLIGTKIDRNSIRETIEKCLIHSEAFGFDSESLTDAIVGCLNLEN